MLRLLIKMKKRVLVSVSVLANASTKVLVILSKLNMTWWYCPALVAQDPAVTIASLLKGGYGFSQHVEDGYKGACVT